MSTQNKSIDHALVWFRNDFRTADNPALFTACQQAKKVTAIFLIAEKQWQQHNLSKRRINYTYQALDNLNVALASLGITLLVKNINWFKNTASAITNTALELNCSALFYNYEYALDEASRDRVVADAWEKAELKVVRSNASVIIPPGKVNTKNGQAFKVFTPFKRAWLTLYPQYDKTPLASPKPIAKPIKPQPLSLPIVDSIPVPFSASEQAAQQRLRTFIDEKISDYDTTRDIPSVAGTSGLSADLTIGLVSPRQCLHLVKLANKGPLLSSQSGSDTWVNEIIWREFYLHVLAANPAISKNKAMRPATEKVSWRYDQKDFLAWCEGKTGFPLVDAAMMQLNQTGWMHNRLRMVTATFLTKYLLIDWRWGEAYFMQQLFDGHFAANNGGWQWCASTGTDAAPYFRILQPIRQAERFDPDAIFIKRYLPQLHSLSSKTINTPGHPELLATGYPPPIVDLSFGKQRCLEAFKAALNHQNI